MYEQDDLLHHPSFHLSHTVDLSGITKSTGTQAHHRSDLIGWRTDPQVIDKVRLRIDFQPEPSLHKVCGLRIIAPIPLSCELAQSKVGFLLCNIRLMPLQMLA